MAKEGEGTTYLRSNLETDAVQLTYCNPSYLEAKAKGEGYVKEETYRFIKNDNMKKMLLNIVTKAGFYSDLNEIYTRMRPIPKKIQDILSRDIMTDLENIITIREDRITENEGNHVYRTSIAKRRNPNTQGSQEQRLERRMEELESKARRLESQTNKQTNNGMAVHHKNSNFHVKIAKTCLAQKRNKRTYAPISYTADTTMENTCAP